MRFNTNFSLLCTNLENKIMMGEDKYPTIITDIYNLMIYWKSMDMGEVHSYKANKYFRLIFLMHEYGGNEEIGQPSKDMRRPQ